MCVEMAENENIDTNDTFREYRKTGDIKLRNKIAEQYLYIADILAKKFVGRGVEFDDLKQVASYALIKGIDRFDPDLGLQFTTFITPTITGEIKNYFRDKSRMVKVPRRLGETAQRVKAFTTEFEGKFYRKPTVKEIAENLNVTEEEIVSALEISGTVSLDSMLKNDEEENQSLYSLLPTTDDTFDDFETKEVIKSVLKDLSDVERKLIIMRFEKSMSQSDTAKALGVSQMFVSRLERKLLAKLKEKLKDSV